MVYNHNSLRITANSVFFLTTTTILYMVELMKSHSRINASSIDTMKTHDTDNTEEIRALALMTSPVDPDTFIFMAAVFDAAGRMLMPATSTSVDLPEPAASTMDHFARDDHSFNQAMQAVARELVSIKAENPAAYLTRLAMLPDLYNAHASVFRDYLTEISGDPGMVVVAHSLMQAAAVAAVDVSSDGLSFNLADVLAQAHAFAGRAEVSVTLQ